MAELFVTNYNPHFTGVSATAANVIRAQSSHYDLACVGHPLPECPLPIVKRQAATLSRTPPTSKPFSIWHVRRNPEMRHAIWLRDVCRMPIKIVFTSAAQRLHSAYPRWLIARMDAIIATTDKAAEHVPHVRAVVPHGVDTKTFFPATDRQAAWAALGYGGTHGIATVGRIRPEKGTDQFVQAMIHLLPQHPNMTALVVGRAGRKHQSFLTGLKRKTAAAGLAERLLFIGEVPADELPALMRGLSLIMQLPRYEGYGMAPLEGLASGVPFVATDAGYYRSFSDEGRVGKIVPDARSAAEAATALLSHDTLGKAARHIAETRFSAAAEADGIDAVYQALWHP
jgi:mannosyltransferase